MRLVGNVPDGLIAGTIIAVKLTATDPSGASVSNSFNVNLVVSDLVLVAGAIANQTAPATGGVWAYQFPSSTFMQGDPNAPPVTFSLTGSPPAWMSINAATGAISGTPSTVGSWTVTIKATAASGDTASSSFTVTTANVAPVVVTPIPNPSVVVGATLNFTMPPGTFSDYNGQSLTYAASGMPTVQAGVHYPPVLFYTSTSDDRVGPVQARKMAAKMEGMGLKNVWFYENLEGGHSSGANSQQSATKQALVYTFLWDRLK